MTAAELRALAAEADTAIMWLETAWMDECPLPVSVAARNKMRAVRDTLLTRAADMEARDGE